LKPVNDTKPWSDAMTLDSIIFNEVTLGQMLSWLAAAVVLILLYKIYKFLFGKKKVNLQHTVYFACSHCGWEGHISKFGTRCPKCDAPAGDLPGG
jgi:Zn finger protein HypA/HybF involved in hydrogenase expression